MSPKDKPRVLIVEDNPADILVYKKCLGKTYQIETLLSGEEALGVIELMKPQVVILDINLPGISGYEICKVLRTRPLKDYIGVIIITSNEDPETIEKSLAYGADAFGTKGQVIFQIKALVKSALRIRSTMKELNDVNTRLVKANERLKKLSLTDELTGLYNMRFMAKQMRNEFKRAERYQKPLSVIMLDIDHFKRINDAYDHLTGSHLIHQIGQEISDSTRADIDYAARYGGDEFMIALPETDLQGAFIVADRLRARVADKIFDAGPHAVKLSVSMGLACFAGSGSGIKTVEELTRTADSGLQAAKDAGRNRVCSIQTAAQLHASKSVS